MFLVESSNTEISGASEVPQLTSIGILSTSDNYTSAGTDDSIRSLLVQLIGGCGTGFPGC